MSLSSDLLWRIWEGPPKEVINDFKLEKGIDRNEINVRKNIRNERIRKAKGTACMGTLNPGKHEASETMKGDRCGWNSVIK